MPDDKNKEHYYMDWVRLYERVDTTCSSTGKLDDREVGLLDLHDRVTALEAKQAGTDESKGREDTAAPEELSPQFREGLAFLLNSIKADLHPEMTGHYVVRPVKAARCTCNDNSKCTCPVHAHPNSALQDRAIAAELALAAFRIRVAQFVAWVRPVPECGAYCTREEILTELAKLQLIEKEG